MSEVKWIKIVTNIFDDEKIRYIETTPNGDETIVIWFRILCLAGKSNSSGLLMMTDRMYYTDELLASIFNRDIKAIQLALSVFERLGMIELIDERILIKNWEKHQNVEALDKIRLQNRERQAKFRATKQPDMITMGIEDENEYQFGELKKPKQKRFVEPTVEELEAFIKENKYQVNAQAFWNFYDAKGWVVGKTKMVSWQSAVRSWATRDLQTPSDKRSEPIPDYTSDRAPMTSEEIDELKERLRKSSVVVK